MAGEGIRWVFIMNFNLNEDQLAYVELAQQFSINVLVPMQRAETRNLTEQLIFIRSNCHCLVCHG